MNLIKDLWSHHILPLLSPIDLCHFQLTSKHAFQLTQSFQPLLTRWKIHVLTRSLNWCLNQASDEGHKDLVKLFINKGANNWNDGLYGASRGGHKDLVQLFIDKGADDWGYGLYGASRGGHKDLVLFLIDKGANLWNWGLAGASEGGHRELIQFFQNKLKRDNFI